MIECTRFKSYQKGHLQGFADLYIPKWGVEINGCSLYVKDGRRWLNLPAKEYENEQGEKKFAPFLRFKQKEHYGKFMEMAKKAVEEYCAHNVQPEPTQQQPMSGGFTSEADGELPF